MYRCCSVAKSCLTVCDLMDSARQAPLSFTISWSSPKFVSVELVILSNHLILCCPVHLLPMCILKKKKKKLSWSHEIRDLVF